MGEELAADEILSIQNPLVFRYFKKSILGSRNLSQASPMMV